MNPSSELSVVIPVYNGESYIEPTLDSVRRQTVSPLELLVIDDGSTDRTSDLVDAYRLANPELRMRLIRLPHGGPGQARNRGIEEANGAWIAFLDSDDLWFPEKLEQVARFCDAFPDANFFCHNELHRHLDGTETLLDYAVGFSEKGSLSTQLYLRNRFSTSAVVCSRCLLIEAGLFDTSLSSAQDYELWLRMSPRIRAQVIPQTLGIYVDRLGNITSMSRWRRYRNVLRVLNRHRSMVSVFMYVKTVTRLTASYAYNWAVRSPINWIQHQFISADVNR
jgi:glycosyltransferase involved in cell wall biosynthesis